MRGAKVTVSFSDKKSPPMEVVASEVLVEHITQDKDGDQ